MTVDSGLVEAGEVLARRYRLEHPVGWPADAPAEVWRARDEVLARPVAVKVLGVRERQATAFLEAAARAGAVDARPLTRIYDAAVEPRGRRSSLVYVISEWVDGLDLADLLTGEGPLPAAQVRTLGLQAAAALADVHASGAVHGRLHPGNVLVTPTGRLRVTDTEVAAVLHGGARPTPDGDVRDLAAVLSAMLTGTWPADATAQPARGLPAGAPGSSVDGPGVGAVVQRALHPDGQLPATAAGLRAALEAASAAPEAGPAGGRGGPTASRGPQAGASRRLPAAPQASGSRSGRPAVVVPARSPRRRRGLLAGLLALLLAGTAAASYALTRSPDPGPPAPPAAAPAATVPVPVDLATAAVRDFDPAGSPPQENPEQVVRAYDGDPATAWTTDGYRSALLGGLKSGVGLLVDLGAPTALVAVEVDLAAAGTAVELRAGDDPAALAVVAAADGPAAVRLPAPDGTTARYWAVWLTRLPPDGELYRGGVAELRLLR